MKHVYFNLQDVEEIYEQVNGGRKGVNRFLDEAKTVATWCHGHYEFRDEEALFEVFERFLPNILEARGIDCFGRLMQYIS